MIKANFNSYNNYITDSLYQWDLNQELVINGLNLSTAPEIHFANANMDRAIVRQSTLESGVVTVRIPNSLLQEALTVKAYVGIYEDEVFRTIEVIEIPVNAKARPFDYALTDNDEEIYSFKALENKLDTFYGILGKNNQVAPLFVDSIDECTNITRLYVLPDGYIYAYKHTGETESGYQWVNTGHVFVIGDRDVLTYLNAAENAANDAKQAKADAESARDIAETGARFSEGFSSEAYDCYVSVSGMKKEVIEARDETVTAAEETKTLLEGIPGFATDVSECVDTSKMYVLPDGYLYKYKETVIIPYKNQIPFAIDSNGNTYNGKGYDDTRSGFIPVTKDDIIRFKNCNINVNIGDVTLTTYDATFTRLSGFLLGASTMTYYTYETDDDGYLTLFDTSKFAGKNANVVYVAFSEVSLSEDSIITINQEITDPIKEYAWVNTGIKFSSSNSGGEQESDVLQSFLTGKTLIACGDSITDGTNGETGSGYYKNYAQIVAERNGMTFVKNAVSGSTMAYNANSDNDRISTRAFSNTRYLDLPDFDYLTIWFGWNDASYSTLGTINDTDNTTFYGAYKVVLEHLITNNPTKKIGLIVPYGRETVEPFAQAVRDISKMYGVPCLDLRNYNECSGFWGTENNVLLARRNALTYDTTHPNQAGHEYLSTMYEAFLKRL